MVGVGGDIYGADYREAITIAAIANSTNYLPPELQNFMDSIVGNTFSIDVRSAVAEQQHNFEVGAEHAGHHQQQVQTSPEELEQNWQKAIMEVQNDLSLASLHFDFQDLGDRIESQTQAVADVREHNNGTQIV